MLAERLLTLVEERLRFDAAIAFVTATGLARWHHALGVMNLVAAMEVAGKQAELAALPPQQIEDAMVLLSGAGALLVPALATLRG